jgi:hypothetical protein
VASALQAFSASAERLGVAPSRLAWGLRELVRCVLSQGDGERRASGLTGLALEAVDAAFKGYLDEDLLLSIVRPIASMESPGEGCSRFLASLRGG